MPSSSPELMVATDELERAMAAIRAWSLQPADELDRNRLVELRRRFSKALAEVGSQGERRLSRHEALRVATFRDRLSKFRSCIALHQANWSAVSVSGANVSHFRASAGKLQQEADELIGWLRAT